MILSRLIISAVSICGVLFATEGSGHGDTVHEGGWMEKWLSFDPGVFMWTIVTFFIVLADRKSTRLNSSHALISYAVFCLKKKKKTNTMECIDV